ncbi:MAG: DUF4031 domain-containing protein [Geminicoccaceae bacterium]
MAIYVDDYEGQFGRMVMCHLLSDESVDELHEFARRIGMKREWFQDGSAPHYDVCKSRRVAAIENGAIEISCRTKEWREVYHKARALKSTPKNKTQEE